MGQIIEATDDGLYLWDDVPHVKMTAPDGSEQVYVTAEAFMEIQRERDECRRALAFINAWRTTEYWWRNREHLHRILDRAGMDYESGKATEGVLQWARANAPAEE